MKIYKLNVERIDVPDEFSDHQLKVLKKWAKYWNTSILLKNGIRVDRDGTVAYLKVTGSQLFIT